MWVASFAVDTPFFPDDLVSRLRNATREHPRAVIAVASSQGRLHPVFALWSTALAGELRAALERGERKMETFIRRFAHISVEWAVDDGDPFFNINTLEELRVAEQRLYALQST